MMSVMPDLTKSLPLSTGELAIFLLFNAFFAALGLLFATVSVMSRHGFTSADLFCLLPADLFYGITKIDIPSVSWNKGALA